MLTADSINERPLVLVVDDEESICSTLSGVLEDESFRTATARDGIDAVDKVRQLNPALVFLDIWMPGSDGIQTLEKIKEISPQTEVVMISGHATISNALEATRRGAFDFIEKPFDIESVVFSANRALERRRSLLQAQTDSPSQGASVNLQSSSIPPLLSHRGISSKALAGRYFTQRTLKDSVVLYGHCLHSGQKSGLVLEPLPRNSGIHFARIGHGKAVPAFVDYVESTGFATTIRSGSTDAATIEHLMATFHAYRLTNILVKCNGEVPIFDGSAVEFCSAVERIGIEEQGGQWAEFAVDEPITVSAKGSQPGESITIEPADSFSVRYELNYPAPVGTQTHEFVLDGVERFKKEIAPARTFGFMKDIEKLQKAGLAAGGRLDNFILIGPDKVVNTELRFENELARHKILDILGDLFLLGRPLRAKVTARMTGHSDNVELLKQLRAKL